MATIQCNDCGRSAAALAWRCSKCGGSLDLIDLPHFDHGRINTGDFSLWRYGAMLPVSRRFSLGEGLTPLASLNIDGGQVFAKLDYLNPTGSYKDRGATTMLNCFAGLGVKNVIDNSSGNAGASIAAYASLAGMHAKIFVPAASALESKKKLIRGFGGRVVEAEDHTAAAYAEAERTTYASHAWSPYFVLGQMTAAWETWEQLGRRAPDAVATPVGHGGLFLGFYRGFKALLAAGLISRLPRMIAVQSSGVDPIVSAWESRSAAAASIKPGYSIADGILVHEPVRGKQILAALYESGGFALRVDNEAIELAQRRMARMGLIIEMTSAVPVAALSQMRERLEPDSTLVIALTGNGLKNLA